MPDTLSRPIRVPLATVGLDGHGRGAQADLLARGVVASGFTAGAPLAAITDARAEAVRDRRGA